MSRLPTCCQYARRPRTALLTGQTALMDRLPKANPARLALLTALDQVTHAAGHVIQTTGGSPRRSGVQKARIASHARACVRACVCVCRDSSEVTRLFIGQRDASIPHGATRLSHKRSACIVLSLCLIQLSASANLLVPDGDLNSGPKPGPTERRHTSACMRRAVRATPI